MSKIILADESNSIKAHTLWIPYKCSFQGYKSLIRSITAFDIVELQLKMFKWDKMMFSCIRANDTHKYSAWICSHFFTNWDANMFVELKAIYLCHFQ